MIAVEATVGNNQECRQARALSLPKRHRCACHAQLLTLSTALRACAWLVVCPLQRPFPPPYQRASSFLTSRQLLAEAGGSKQLRGLWGLRLPAHGFAYDQYMGMSATYELLLDVSIRLHSGRLTPFRITGGYQEVISHMQDPEQAKINGDRHLVKSAHGPLQRPSSIENLQPRSDLSHAHFEQREFTDVSVRQSYLNGVLARNCRFTRVNLERSDLVGARIEHTTFDACSFADADLRGSVFSTVTFSRCDFSRVLLEDAVFVGCEITNCDFNHGTVSECDFTHTNFDQLGLQVSIWRHNRFESCRITSTELGNCTFLYNFFEQIVFQDAWINLDAIGLTFGITVSDMIGVGLIYLGERGTKIMSEDQVRQILQSYEDRHMALHVATTRLNFGISTPFHSMRELTDAALSPAQNGMPVQPDEVRFITRIFTVLSERGELPLLGCVQTAKICTEILRNSYLHDPFKRAASEPTIGLLSSLRMFAVAATDQIEHLLDKTERSLGEGDVVVSVRFRTRPQTDISELLSLLSEELNLPNTLCLRFLREEAGSVIQLFIGATGAALLLVAILSLLNGVIDQLIIMKSKLRILAEKDPTPKAFTDLVRKPMALKDLPVDVIGKLVRAVLNLQILNDPGLGGLARENIQEVAIDRSQTAEHQAGHRTN